MLLLIYQDCLIYMMDICFNFYCCYAGVNQPFRIRSDFLSAIFISVILLHY